MNGDGLMDEVGENTVTVEVNPVLQDRSGEYAGSEGPVKKKVMKKRKSAEYVLEKYQPMLFVLTEDSEEGQEAGGTPMWVEMQKGFKSSEAALKHVEKEKMEGVFRVVRIVAGPCAATLVTPDPVFSMEKLNPKDY